MSTEITELLKKYVEAEVAKSQCQVVLGLQAQGIYLSELSRIQDIDLEVHEKAAEVALKALGGAEVVVTELIENNESTI